jgi:hypothetical protein
MNPSFELVPGDINFFISHPLITGLLTNRVSLMILVLLALSVLYLSITKILKKKPLYILTALVAIAFVLLAVTASHRARIAMNPDSQTIIATILKDKQIVRRGIWPEYYFVTEIEGKRYGVATSKNIYTMEMYGPGATFDYSLYTYRTPTGYILYRFLKPEFKLKAQRGNLQ